MIHARPVTSRHAERILGGVGAIVGDAGNRFVAHHGAVGLPDILSRVLKEIGPADVMLSTWGVDRNYSERVFVDDNNRST